MSAQERADASDRDEPRGMKMPDLTDYTWLRDLAQSRGLHNADRIPSDPGKTPIEAWETVQNVTGLSATELEAQVAAHFGLDVADPLAGVDKSTARFLSEKIARRIHSVPIVLKDGALVVATAAPGISYLMDVLKEAVGRPARLVVMQPYAVEALIVTVYGAGSAGHHSGHVDVDPDKPVGGFTVRAVDDAGREQHPEQLNPRGSATAHLVSLLFSEALALEASDIHLQPIGGGGFARFRVDGVLGHGLFLPGAAFRQVITRIKALAGMDIADPFRAQDGRIFLDAGLKSYDVRISALPTGDLQTMVMRILDPNHVKSIVGSGYKDPELSQLQALLKARQGVVLVTGPTGSGKSTTLHGALWELHQADVDIHTIEDPVEYTLPGASQVQVDEKRGITFPSALRSILRQDPDIILIGEIRDAETAQIAAQAALTGHLVLSTLHTNDAATAIPRLLDLGVNPSYLGEILVGVVAQRLARKLCDACAAPLETPESEEEKRFQTAFGRLPDRRAVGCDACRFTGYRGRLPVTQVLAATREVRDAIIRGDDLLAIRHAGRATGMRTLAESAFDMVVQGDTTPEEAVRVLGASFWSDLEDIAAGEALPTPS